MSIKRSKIGKGCAIWEPVNIYGANIGQYVSVGAFTEIGHGVRIGDGTRIGMGCFLCEGVIIGKGVFLGPKVCTTNDKRPPSPRMYWEKTVIEDGACIGAAVTILCGVTIGAGALIGCGSVVTKNVPPGETWAGVPARKMKEKK